MNIINSPSLSNPRSPCTCIFTIIGYKRAMKIIMMSDYRTCIGGIEQYIQDAAQLLTSQNYETTVV